MLKAILFAVLFAVVGLILFSLVAPLLLPEARLRAAGAIAFPFVVLVCGTAGFILGWRGRKR
jgi:hypothetical protein